MALVGKKAPDFTADAIIDNEIKKVSLSDYTYKKWVVLLFYPFDFTQVTTSEIISFSDAYEDFTNHNAEILGLSTDSIYSLLSYVNTPENKGGLGNINYPLISDFTKKISESYNVISTEGIILRATFIIDPEGIVQFELIHSNYMGRNVKEVLRNIYALQYVIENKVVCPESWVPGKDTIEPDPEKKLEFFKKHVKGHL